MSIDIGSNQWTLGGKECLRADPTYYPEAAGLANSYWCPVGYTAGRAWVLLFRDEIKALLDTGATYHTLTIREGGFFGGSSSLSFPGMVIASARNVSGGEVGDRNGVYLVELFDRREVVRRMSVLDEQYNILMMAPHDYPRNKDDDLTADAFYLESLDSGSLWTWESMVADMWGSLSGIVGAWPGFATGGAVTNQKHPRNMYFRGVNAWQAICDVLWRQRRNLPVYDPVADSITIASLWENANGFAIAGTSKVNTGIRRKAPVPIMDAAPLAARLDRLPATINVVFPSVWERGHENTLIRDGNWLVDDSSRTVVVTTNLPGAVSGSSVTIWDNTVIVNSFDQLFSGTVYPVADQKERAESAALSWLAERGIWATSSVDGDTALSLSAHLFYDPTHTIYTGLPKEIMPNVFHKSVLWRDYGDGLMTEAVWGPGLPMDQRGEAGGTGQIAWRTSEGSLPPDWGRRTWPNYPDVMQFANQWKGSHTNSITNIGSRKTWLGRLLIGGDFGTTGPNNRAAASSAATINARIYDLQEAEGLTNERMDLGKVTGTSADYPLMVTDSRTGQWASGSGQTDKDVTSNTLAKIEWISHVHQESDGMDVHIANDRFVVEGDDGEYGIYFAIFTATANHDEDTGSLELLFYVNGVRLQAGRYDTIWPSDNAAVSHDVWVTMLTLLELDVDDYLEVWGCTKQGTATLRDMSMSLVRIGGKPDA